MHEDISLVLLATACCAAATGEVCGLRQRREDLGRNSLCCRYEGIGMVLFSTACCAAAPGEVWSAAEEGGPGGDLPPHRFTIYFKEGGRFVPFLSVGDD